MEVGSLAPMPTGAVGSVVFFGTPAVAARVLSGLFASGVEIELVVTGADVRRGRGAQTTPSPVREVADTHGVPVVFDPNDVLKLPASGSRLGVVVAYGRILRAPLLESLPMVNVHFSQLPRWRGAAPVERAILNGDTTIGVDLMRVVAGLDEGDVFGEVILPIRDDHDVEALRNDLVDAALPLVVSSLKSGFGIPRPQAGEPIYAHKITKDELRVNWEDSALSISRLVRIGGGATRIDGADLKLRSVRVADQKSHGEPGTILDDTAPSVATGDGVLQLLEVQPAGKRVMPASDWARGARIKVGSKFERITHG